MKKFMAVILFLIFLIPGWARAEESTGRAAGAGCTASCAAEKPGAEHDFSLADWNEKNGTRLTDGELCLVKGRMIVANIPESRSSSSYRIVLWDEGNGNGDSAIHRGSGLGITVISR